VGADAARQGGGSQTRIHLNHLGLQSFGFEETLGLGNELGRHRVTPAGVDEADFLHRLGGKALSGSHDQASDQERGKDQSKVFHFSHNGVGNIIYRSPIP